MSEKREKCDECKTTYIAAAKGHVKCLEYLVANDISNGSQTWHEETTYTAAANGHKEILEICVANNCPWDPQTTRGAAANGHKEILEYCVKNNWNCNQVTPWHPETTWVAARNGRKECLEYIFENCKDFVSWEDSGLEKHMNDYSKEIQEYLLSVKEEWQWYGERCQDIKG